VIYQPEKLDVYVLMDGRAKGVVLTLMNVQSFTLVLVLRMYLLFV
jgi:hypothetical protein